MLPTLYLIPQFDKTEIIQKLRDLIELSGKHLLTFDERVKEISPSKAGNQYIKIKSAKIVK